MASKKTATSRAKPKKSLKRRLGMSLLYIACIAMAVIFKGRFIFLLFGMLPSVVAFISDPSKEKEIYRCVMACNLAGLLPHVPEVFMASSEDALRIITEPSLWLGVYTFAGIGWLLVWIMPHLSEVLTEINYHTRIARLEERQRRLIEEWGPEIQRKPESPV